MDQPNNGEYIFARFQNFRAAQFAYQEAGAGKNIRSALKEGVKAFLLRKVVVVDGRKLTPCRQKTLQDFIIKGICTRNAAKVPGHFVERRGNAETDSKQAVVCIWGSQGIVKPGHASLLLEDKEQSRQQYLSYWPAKGSGSDLNKRGALKHRKGESSGTIFQDMEDELSPRSHRRLAEGEAARARITQGQEKLNDKYNAQFKPHVDQVKITNNDTGETFWGKLPEKVYMPCMGDTVDGEGKPRFRFFGLDMLAMDGHLKKVKEKTTLGKAYYRLADPWNSCAGKVKENLMEGGIERFAPVKTNLVYTKPNEVYRAASEAQHQMDKLNGMVDDLEDYYHLCRKSPQLVAFSRIPSLSGDRFQQAVQKYFLEFTQASPKLHFVDDVFKAIHRLMESHTTVNALIPKVKRLVILLDKGKSYWLKEETPDVTGQRLMAFATACLKHAEKDMRIALKEKME
ncbi:hypothetical protein CI610_02084 [invertebrate metagenome]|uniref:Uncharacterized protein n=1 Tax=invertebrate metagenome TaxID=1711999 RepID=A0A2H9T6W3_9ZZZZ